MPDTAAAAKKPDSTAGLRILAFLMAIALWGFVGISQHYLIPETVQRKIKVAIEVKHAPPGPHVRVEPAFVDVVVEGPSKAVERLGEGDITAFVELRFRTPERSPIHVSVPEGMKYQVAPEDVAVFAESRLGSFRRSSRGMLRPRTRAGSKMGPS